VVDVTPVDEVQVGEPSQGLQYRYGIAAAQDEHRATRARSGQIGDLILEDICPRDPGGRRGEILGAHGQFAPAMAVVRAEPDVAGLPPESVSPLEITCVEVDPA